MVVLDTDHMSLWERAESVLGQRIRDRLDRLAPEDRATTIVSFEEQARGWMKLISQARSMIQLVEAYRRLKRQLDNYCQILVLEFDERAATEYQRLQKLRPHLGRMDLRIAAIVLAHNATLLSRNLRDFRKVPGLKVEDWTV